MSNYCSILIFNDHLTELSNFCAPFIFVSIVVAAMRHIDVYILNRSLHKSRSLLCKMCIKLRNTKTSSKLLRKDLLIYS